MIMESTEYHHLAWMNEWMNEWKKEIKSRERQREEKQKEGRLRLKAENQFASVDREGVGVSCLLKGQNRSLHLELMGQPA